MSVYPFSEFPLWEARLQVFWWSCVAINLWTPLPPHCLNSHDHMNLAVHDHIQDKQPWSRWLEESCGDREETAGGVQALSGPVLDHYIWSVAQVCGSLDKLHSILELATTSQKPLENSLILLAGHARLLLATFFGFYLICFQTGFGKVALTLVWLYSAFWAKQICMIRPNYTFRYTRPN